MNRRIRVAGVLVGLYVLMQSGAAGRVAPENSITDIYDVIGTTKSGAVEDWGFAALVRYNGTTILFDTGADPGILERNVKALGLDLSTVDIAILSHAHNDHAAGFPYFLSKNTRARVYLPDDGVFFSAVGTVSPAARDASAQLPPEERFYGGQTPQRKIVPAGMFAGRANVQAVEKSAELAPGLYLIHTVSPLLGSFSAYPPNSVEKPALDGLTEVSLALRTPKGIVLITGCSHSKVERIVAETKQVTGAPVDLVEGGFHLIGYSKDTIAALANQLKNDLGVRRVAPTHCTGERAMAVFREVYGENYVRAGLETVIKF